MLTRSGQNNAAHLRLTEASASIQGCVTVFERNWLLFQYERNDRSRFLRIVRASTILTEVRQVSGA